MIRLPAIFALLLIPIPVSAQETVSDYLLTAFEDSEVTGYQNQIDFIRPQNYRIPVLDELELRVGNDELIYEDLQYAVRVRPSNPWLIRRNKAFFNATREELSARKRLEFKQALQVRYEQALSFFEARELQNSTQSQLDLLREQTNIFQENPESSLFDAKDFVEAKLDMVEDIEQLNDLMIDVDRARRTISLTLGNRSFEWNEFELITISTIDSLSNEIARSVSPSAEVDYLTKRAEVARQEVRKEKADFDIGFVQAEYFPFTNRDSEFGFAAGITIPIFRNNKPQIAERKLDQLDLESELITEQKRDSVNKVVELEYLKSTITHYELLEDEVNKLGLEELKSNLSKSSDFNPIVITELEIASLRLRELLIESKYRVLEQFIDFIFAFDAPIQQPLTNYLSNKLVRIQ
jgi:hypothetical protein